MIYILVQSVYKTNLNQTQWFETVSEAKQMKKKRFSLQYSIDTKERIIINIQLVNHLKKKKNGKTSHSLSNVNFISASHFTSYITEYRFQKKQSNITAWKIHKIFFLDDSPGRFFYTNRKITKCFSSSGDKIVVSYTFLGRIFNIKRMEYDCNSNYNLQYYLQSIYNN